MDCKNCKKMKKFRQLLGIHKIEYWCCHEKVEKMPSEIFGNRAPGFICYADEKGAPRTKTHPRWCPLPTENVKKGQYVAEWDEEKGKIALKFNEDKVDSGLKFLDDRYAVICEYKGYAICTLKVAVPSEHDALGYVIDDVRFEGLVFGNPEEAMVAINDNPE